LAVTVLDPGSSQGKVSMVSRKRSLVDEAMGRREAPSAPTAASPAAGIELVRYWGVVGAWMLVITLLSSDPFSASNTNRYIDPVLRYFFPELTPAGFVLAHSVIRKAAHLFEFAVLGALSYWASRRGRPPRWRARWALQALIIAGGFALIDEAHQRFVASRTGSLLDSAIDFAGAALAQAAIYLRSMRTGDR
jgi:VanZ family protein